MWPLAITHHLGPSALLPTSTAPPSVGIPSGVSSVTARISSSSTNVYHFQGRGPRTSLDAIPLGWLRGSRKERSKRNSNSCLSISSSVSYHLSCFPNARARAHTHICTHIHVCFLLSRKMYMHLTSITLGLESKVFSYLKFTVHLLFGRACKLLSGCFYSQH